ncbi:MAG: glycosyltransferase [Chitinophagales bacterium]
MEPEFDTLLVSGMKDDEEESSEFIVRELDLHPVYVPDMYRELNPFKDYKSYYKLRKIIEEYKPDIVHTHAAKAGAVGRLAASHSGVPVIVHTFHGHVFHSYFNAAKTRVFLEIERYLAKRTTKIIALSELQKQELTETYKIAPADKFQIVPLGFDLRKFGEHKQEKRAAFRKQYRLDDAEVAIGIVGRLVPIKNHELFLKAIKSLLSRTTKTVRAFIVGDGEERARLEALACELGLTYRHADEDKDAVVIFTSWIKQIDVSNAGMDIIALTSKNEGTPVSLIEAQASGRPIVSTAVGGITDVVIPDETALLSPSGDVEGFAKNLALLVNDESLRHKMSQSGVQHVYERFSHNRLCSDMRTLYNQLLA